MHCRLLVTATVLTSTTSAPTGTTGRRRRTVPTTPTTSTSTLTNTTSTTTTGITVALSALSPFPRIVSFFIEMIEDTLYHDLLDAFHDACRHKKNKPYVVAFCRNLEENLNKLYLDLKSRTYKPQKSTCFIINDPKTREVFAANFTDRIVHHLYYNYVHILFERTFIQDSYSCIKGRGTHHGIQRLFNHIRQSSQNYTRDCYVLKMDLSGYFMHINRNKLLALCLETLKKMSSHRVKRSQTTTWNDILDIDFLIYLSREIILHDPTKNCTIIGHKSDWDNLPHNKSLFHSPPDCGLPIGNLTSQLFSNVYLNVFDQFVKRELKQRHYGRYVDDFYIVGNDIDELRSLVPKITKFLKDTLSLDVNEGKTILTNIYQGVEFLGYFVLPYRIYLSRNSLLRMVQKLKILSLCDNDSHKENSIMSYLGQFSHWQNFRAGVKILSGVKRLC